MHLNVLVVRLREQDARALVADPDRLVGLGEEVARDLRRGVLLLVLQAGGVTVVGATALGFLVFRRRRRTLYAGGAGAVAVVVAAGLTLVTLDRGALYEPRYSGLLAAAPTAVGDVRDIAGRLDLYSKQLGRITTGVSQLYAVTSNLPTFTPDDDTLRVLHVSDLHLSPTAFGIIRSVVKQFDVDVVADTGDITDFGTEPESRLPRRHPQPEGPVRVRPRQPRLDQDRAGGAQHRGDRARRGPRRRRRRPAPAGLGRSPLHPRRQDPRRSRAPRGAPAPRDGCSPRRSGWRRSSPTS